MKLRLAIGATALVVVLAGTAWGQDDEFPVGPFRMYATAARPTGTVRVAELFGVRADGTRVLLQAHDVGLRRAELEGQLPRFRKDPTLLAALATPEYLEIRLEERQRRVVDRRVQRDETRVLVASWHR
ncbi:MAG: hypothetical protein QOD30_225 [Actinomycetota bacterium]|nr:hypothetical protein [Actinomycetota bacterium]